MGDDVQRPPVRTAPAAAPAAGDAPLSDPRSFFEHHFSLPPLPAVVDRLLRTLESGRATASDVGDLLASDPGLTAQILKLVNSAYYGLPRSIRDVRHAVAYLGFAEIQRITLTVAVIERLSPDDAEGFERFWFHSFYTALASKILARRFARGLDIEELHVAALLHDVGKLVYLKFFPEHYRRLQDHARRERCSLSTAEKALDLPSHATYGAVLAERWELPRLVRQACAWHELEHLADDPPEGADRDALNIVATANLLSNLATEDLADEYKLAIREAAMDRLDCSEEEFLLLMGELYEVRNEVQQFLGDL